MRQHTRTTHRLATLTTALLVGASGALALGVAPAQADEVAPLAATAPAASGVEGPAAPEVFDGGTAAGRAATPELTLERGAAAPQRAKHQWPVRLRTGPLRNRVGGTAPSAEPSRQLASAGVTQDRLTGQFGVELALRAAATEATNTRLRVGFGKVVTSNGQQVCQAQTGSTDVDRNTYGTTGAYNGASIAYRVDFPQVRRNVWNCGFVLLVSPDGATIYDGLVGTLRDIRQKPALGIFVKGRKVNNRSFTRVPVTIRNSKQTIATAPKVTISWRTRGAAVRGKRMVGTIKPGAAKKGAIYVRKTSRGPGKIWLTVKSKTYKRTVVLRIRNIR
ncbi:hypothetical protein [Nocardioides nanhaiensis]|uniref:Uncharacterized protein n=1 Tax=Nocardioides nanhaiensis TaxID=1476871 RepID=A0ABP8X4U0_9ACTN